MTCGLRDYGTATWEGGKNGCDHSTPRSRGDDIKNGDKQGTSAGSGPNTQLICKCGAKRIDKQFGLEKTPEEYIENTVTWAREVWRVLRKDGTFWLNLGDSYYGYHGNSKVPNNEAPSNKLGYIENMRATTVGASGLKPKDLCEIPSDVVRALRADGWWLRSRLPWVKRAAMPESCSDRPASALEYMFLLTKSSKYYFDMESIRKPAQDWGIRDRSNMRNGTIDPKLKHYGLMDCNSAENGRNFRNTDLFYQSLEKPHGAIFAGEEMIGLDVNPQLYSEAHFATFPEKLVEPCIKAGTSEKGACPECGAPWERVFEKTEEYRKITTRGNKPNSDKLGAFLKESREKLNLAQNEVSKYFPSESGGITGCVSNWELGKNVPTIEQWEKLTEILNLTNDFDEQVDDWWNPSGSSAWTEGHNLNEKLVKRQGTAHPSQVPPKSRTIGWQPTCKHKAESVPCVVLDPFGGSGTTKNVADRLGRYGIMTELKMEYIEMAKKRCHQLPSLFA